MWPNPDDPSEPKWLDDDREWALALVEIEAAACPGCGEPFDVSTDPESEGAYKAESVRCWACWAQAHPGDDPDDKSGLLVTFTRRPDPKEQTRG